MPEETKGTEGKSKPMSISVELDATEVSVILEGVMKLPLALADRKHASAIRVVEKLRGAGQLAWGPPAAGGG